eukprot:m.49650 g.49650  ORF g.49650 m.49650 type:complete len:324 (+) comp15064_c0_seq1:571-1542(+)
MEIAAVVFPHLSLLANAALNAVVPRATQVTVSALYIYPIKSCKGIRVRDIGLDALGFEWDRRWMVVSRSTGQFLTQRKYPRMSQISTALNKDTLTVSDAGQADLVLPLAYAEKPDTRTVTIWGQMVTAAVVSDAADAWFSKALGCDCQLVRTLAPAAHARPVDPAFTSPLQQPHIAFADGFPFLLLSEESVAHLCQRSGEHIDVLQFRPNIVVRGCAQPHAEDGWQAVRLAPPASSGAAAAAAVDFLVVKDCTRCNIPTIDPATGKFHPNNEPTRTMQTYRVVDRKPLFGQNLLHVNRTGRVREGDELHVLRSKVTPASALAL